METENNNSNSKTKAILVIIGLLAGLFFIASLVLHLTPLGLIEYVEDFAVHHYFLMGFISLVIMLVCLKIFFSLDNKIDLNYRENRSPELRRVRRKRNKILNLFIHEKNDSNEDESYFIPIDQINSLSFTQADVLMDEEAKLQRQNDIKKATILSNSYKHKIMVLFKDNESKKHLVSTIWQSTPEHITLKGGVILPVKSIYKIEF